MASNNTASTPGATHFKRRMSAIAVSLAVSVLLMAAKFYVFHLTRSSAVLSDALESIINVVAAAFGVASIWMAAQPPDADHPYGHGKIEYFSAGFEGALIILAALGIFKTGLSRLLTPQPIANLEAGLAILMGISAVNLLLGIGLIRVGNRVQSLTLIADGKHVLVDVYTSAGVLVGLFLVHLTGWLWLDGAIACLLGVNILCTGMQLVRQSFSALMHASDPELLKEITQVLEAHRQAQWIGIHHLRAWRSGHVVNVDLHLVLPRESRLDQAHADAEALERLLIDHFKGHAAVLVHMEPCGTNSMPDRQAPCWQGCSQRSSPHPESDDASYIKFGSR
jgi:cation diffusion facilitator family transporter